MRESGSVGMLPGESARSAFLEHEDTPRKRLLRAWYAYVIVLSLLEDENGHL